MKPLNCDIQTLYRFSLLVVGCPIQAEHALKKAISGKKPLSRLWQELSRCDPLLGECYTKRLCCCGVSDRLCDLLCDLYWDERGLLLLKLLIHADQESIAEITALPEKRLFRLFSTMHARCEALAHSATA